MLNLDGKEITIKTDPNISPILIECAMRDIHSRIQKIWFEMHRLYTEKGSKLQYAKRKVTDLDKKKFQFYTQYTGQRPMKWLEDKYNELTSYSDQIEAADFKSKEGVAKIWLELYIPDKGLKDGLYNKMSTAAYEQFKYVYFSGYNRDTMQSCMTIIMKKDKPIDVQSKEILLLLDMVKENKEGYKYMGISPADGCESGVPAVLFKGDESVIKFTRYHHTSEVFKGTVKECLSYIYNNYGNGE